MLIDPKREKMYFDCRIRKKNIDKKMAVIRAILVIPPVLIFIFTAVDLVMSMLGDAAVLATGAGLYGYEVVGTSPMYLLDLFSCVLLAVIGIGLAFLETEFIVKKSVVLYAAAALLFFILLFTSDYIPILIYALLAVIAIPLAIWCRKLIAEDRRMSTLDGYPHFDPSLMKHNDVPFTPATRDELDGMTPEERIMYEREH